MAKSTSKPPLRAYLDIERAVYSRVVETWRTQASGLWVKVDEALANKRWDDARRLVDTIDLRDAGEANRDWIKYTLFAAARFGARQANPNGTLAFEAQDFEALLTKQSTLFLASLERSCTQQVQRRAMQLIAQLERDDTEQIQKDEERTKRFPGEFVSFADTGDKQIQMTSSLHTSRLAAWGFLAEATARNITSYQLQAVLDNRTSDFCEQIDGRTFDVSDGREKLFDALNVADPEDLRDVQPFPPQDSDSIDAFDQMSDDDLAEAGYLVPPFHPWCRTILVEVDQSDQADQSQDETSTDDTPEDPQPDDPEQGDSPETDAVLAAGVDEEVTLDQFRELGLQITQDEVDYWNAHIGVSPALIFGKFADFDPQEVLDGLLETGIQVDDETGTLSLTASGPKDGGHFDMNVVLDPNGGSIYSNYLETEGIDPESLGGFLQALYLNLVDEADAQDYADVTVGADGTAAQYAQLGFLPSQADWDSFRGDIIASIGPDTEFDDVVEGLTDLELDLVMSILAQSDPKAVWLLLALPFEVGDKTVGERLLEDSRMEMSLPVQDPQALQLLNGDTVEGPQPT